MMKKLFAILLSLLTVFGLGMTVCAKTGDAYTEAFREASKYNDWFDDAAYTASVPVCSLTYNYKQTFEELYTYAKEHRRAVGIYRDGVLTEEELSFSNRDGVWKIGTHQEKSDLGAVIERYGNDFLLIKERTTDYAIFPDHPDTMYRLEDLLQENPEPYAYTFTQYKRVVGYIANYKGEGVLGNVNAGKPSLPITDELLAKAESYWDYVENKPAHELQFGIVFFGIIGMVAAGLITLAVVLYKRRQRNTEK